MSVHQHDNNMRDDQEFIKGEISLLVPGNKCRLLDGRRTTGYIENYFEESVMFRWRITKYEDEGKFWDLPAEDITKFQFAKDSERLSHKKLIEIKSTIDKYNSYITIKAQNKDKAKTEILIEDTKKHIKSWLINNSTFLKHNSTLDFDRKNGYSELYADIKNYMESQNILKQEQLTTENMVLNPFSGEWIKGLRIMLAELGIVSYYGKEIRTNNIFKGEGKRVIRRKYLINRLAFIRAYIELLDIDEIVLYRGMSTDKDWIKKDRTFLSCTFNQEVAEDFCCLKRDSKYKNAYLLKMTYPISNLFMSFFETEAMNNQYEEAEALILYSEPIKI